MENELEHHGILGMHWGVRRTPEELGHGSNSSRKKDGSDDDDSEGGSGGSGSSGSSGKGGSSGEGSSGGNSSEGKSSSDDSKSSSGGKSSGEKSIDEMTLDELREKVSRIQLQNQYMSLLKQQEEASTGPVKRLLNEAITNLGRQSLSALTNKMVNSIINNATKNKDEEQPFDPEVYKNADPLTLDPATLEKISKWWENAAKIKANQNKYNHQNGSSDS